VPSPFDGDSKKEAIKDIKNGQSIHNRRNENGKKLSRKNSIKIDMRRKKETESEDRKREELKEEMEKDSVREEIKHALREDIEVYEAAREKALS
jgi:hypothetical protein